jgi:hypothetical protein
LGVAQKSFGKMLGERTMSKNDRRTARMPATKFPNLRKKLQKGKLPVNPARKK